MIDLYYWTTPNGHKITTFLEETGTPHTIKPINISKGEQFQPDFLPISPNSRILATVDHAPGTAASPCLSSNPALSRRQARQVLAHRPTWRGGSDRVADGRARTDGRPEPSFRSIRPPKLPYAIGRYVKETSRLYGVPNKRLADQAFVAGDYSIADMATYPWIVPHERRQQKLEDFPHLERWFETINAAQSRQVPFGQTASVVR